MIIQIKRIKIKIQVIYLDIVGICQEHKKKRMCLWLVSACQSESSTKREV